MIRPTRKRRIEKGDIVICVEALGETEYWKEYKVKYVWINANGEALLDLGIRSKHRRTGEIETCWCRLNRFILCSKKKRWWEFK